MEMFTVRDSALGEYGNPFCARTIPEATRIFLDEARNPESQINKHPEDYTLHHLGSFNPETGTFNTTAPYQVCRALDAG